MPAVNPFKGQYVFIQVSFAILLFASHLYCLLFAMLLFASHPYCLLSVRVYTHMFTQKQRSCQVARASFSLTGVDSSTITVIGQLPRQ